MSVTRLGLYGGSRGPYGNFALKYGSKEYTATFTRLGLYGGSRSPYGDFSLKGLRITVSVNLVTETDSIPADLGRAKAKALGQSEETDSSQGLTPERLYALTIVSEIDVSQTVTPRRSYALGQSEETDTAQDIDPRHVRNVAVVFALETDTALALGTAKARDLGVALESDNALDISPFAGNIPGSASGTVSGGGVSSSITGGSVSSSVGP